MPEQFWLYLTDVHFFYWLDARMCAQFPRELPIPDIQGVNEPRAVLKQAIGEAARGSTDINRDAAAHVNVKNAECLFQFEAAAADVFLWLQHDNIGIGRDAVSRFRQRFAIDTNGACEEEPLRLFSTFGEFAMHE